MQGLRVCDEVRLFWLAISNCEFVRDHGDVILLLLHGLGVFDSVSSLAEILLVEIVLLTVALKVMGRM